MRLHEVVNRYLEFRHIHGAAPNTLRGVRKSLKRFVEVCENPPVATLSADHIDAWAMSLDYLEPSTIRQERSHLRVFLRWARVRGHHKQGEALIEELPQRKVPEKSRRRVPLAHFPLLLSSAEHPRDRMILALGLFLFLRAGEMATIRISDVDLDSGEIQVHVHKAAQVDHMPISLELDHELRTWLTWYSEAVGGLTPDMFLIPARLHPTFHWENGERTTKMLANVNPHRQASHLHCVVQKALTAIGWDDLSDREGIHTLRRSGARALFDSLCDAGVDGAMRRCQAMLHHKNMHTTEHYMGLQGDRASRDKHTKGARMYPSLEGTEDQWSSNASPPATNAGRSNLKAV